MICTCMFYTQIRIFFIQSSVSKNILNSLVRNEVEFSLYIISTAVVMFFRDTLGSVNYI